jgi:hypothetical protein
MGREVLVFQSRGQGLRFMKVIEQICPDVPQKAARGATRADFVAHVGGSEAG